MEHLWLTALSVGMIYEFMRFPASCTMVLTHSRFGVAALVDPGRILLIHLRLQRKHVRAKAGPDGVTSKQISILQQLGKDEDASENSSRRGLLSGAAASVAGGCMCGVCGASPVQAAAPGDWGYSASPKNWALPLNNHVCLRHVWFRYHKTCDYS